MSSATISAENFSHALTTDRTMATKFAGNGLSRTAMVFKLATMAGHKLTVPELNRIKDINPRRLESVYEEVIKMGGVNNARFALGLILK